MNFDRFSERATRRLAGRVSRRSLLSKLGAALIAVPIFPLLPFDRTALAAEPGEFGSNAQTKDDKLCNYWRYCAIDGTLCSCCGGGAHTCPPGTQASPTSWVGTCFNPDDKRTYLIAYRDCCGTTACNQCACNGTEGELPLYKPQANSDIVWCFGTNNMTYHCSTAALVGLAD
jgi:methylamine dehydrogenase light chain